MGGRWPWLARLNAELKARERAVLACSALKESYRRRLGEGLELRYVHLRGTPGLIGASLAARQHRYMPTTLLASQFAALEPPAHAIDVDVAQPAAECVAAILAQLPMCT